MLEGEVSAPSHIVQCSGKVERKRVRQSPYVCTMLISNANWQWYVQRETICVKMTEAPFANFVMCPREINDVCKLSVPMAVDVGETSSPPSVLIIPSSVWLNSTLCNKVKLRFFLLFFFWSYQLKVWTDATVVLTFKWSHFDYFLHYAKRQKCFYFLRNSLNCHLYHSHY